MNKIIVGVGLLICGALGGFIARLYGLPFRIRIISDNLRDYAPHSTMLSDFAVAFVLAGAILCIWGLVVKNNTSTKKVILGTGLFICGALGSFTHNLYTLFIHVGYGLADVNAISPRHPMLSDFSIVLAMVGATLCIWGLADRDKNELKKVVFGTGLIICGVLIVYFNDILHGIVYILPVRRPLEPPVWPAYALIIAGIAFSIWGLIKKDKNSPS